MVKQQAHALLALQIFFLCVIFNIYFAAEVSMKLLHSLLVTLTMAIALSACKPAPTHPQAEQAAPSPAAVVENTTKQPEDIPVEAVVEAKPLPIPADPNPLTVIPLADESQAVESVVPAAGGVLQAESGGVRYTLTIPEGALMSDQDVRLTPVQSIDGLPMSGGLLGAVQLEPEGVRFLKPAVLQIEVQDGFDPVQAAGFAYHGSGQEFHLFPAFVEGNTLRLEIWHFSGYGGGAATPEDIDQQRQNPPTSPEDRLNQEVGDILSKSTAEGADMPVDQLEPILRAYLLNVILPNLKAAETNDKLLDAAAGQLLSFDRMLQLIGCDDLFERELEKAYASLMKGLRNAFDKAYERCIDKPDAMEAGNMLQRLLEIQLMGDDIAGGYTLENKFGHLQNCLTFQLQFDSLVVWELDNNMVLESQVTAEVDLRMDENLLFHGSSELLYRSFRVRFQGESEAVNEICTFNVETKDASVTIEDATINWKNLNGKPEIQIQMPFGPGVPRDRWDMKCQTGSSGGWIETNIPGDMAMWAAGFEQIHSDSRVDGWSSGGGTVYFLHPWQRVGGRVFARHTASKTVPQPNSKVTEDLTVDLIHTPKR
jgi:hypothetical protein